MPTIFKYPEVIDATVEALRNLKGIATVGEIRDEVIKILNCSKVDQENLLNDGSNELDKKLSFARVLLKNNGVIINLKRGTWSLVGDYLKDKQIDANEIFKSRNSTIKKKDNKSLPEREKSNLDDEIVEEELAAGDKDLEEDMVSNMILNKLKTISPRAFEILAVTVLNKIGFDILPTRYVRDNGLDATGSFHLNIALQFSIAVQCKRYEGAHNVKAAEMRAFCDSMNTGGYERGIYFTTSDFTAEAISRAKQSSVELINGKRIADILFEQNIGFIKIDETTYFPEESTKTTYKIDDSFLNTWKNWQLNNYINGSKYI